MTTTTTPLMTPDFTDFMLDDVVQFSVVASRMTDRMALHQAILMAAFYILGREKFDVTGQYGELLLTFDGAQLSGNEYLCAVVGHHTAMLENMFKTAGLPSRS